MVAGRDHRLRAGQPGPRPSAADGRDRPRPRYRRRAGRLVGCALRVAVEGRLVRDEVGRGQVNRFALQPSYAPGEAPMAMPHPPNVTADTSSPFDLADRYCEVRSL